MTAKKWRWMKRSRRIFMRLLKEARGSLVLEENNFGLKGGSDLDE
jgi:hypothetical protein